VQRWPEGKKGGGSSVKLWDFQKKTELGGEVGGCGTPSYIQKRKKGEGGGFLKTIRVRGYGLLKTCDKLTADDRRTS